MYIPLVFTNTSARACTLRGYPGFDALNASGHVLRHAQRTQSGFAGGSTPDENIPSLDAIRGYLIGQRDELIKHLRGLDPAMLEKKPNDQAPWTYREWIKMLAWHEAHHQGQAHAILNLYKNRAS